MWTDKVSVAKDMMENKLFSKKFIYDQIFHMSEDDAATITNDIVEDTKQLYRFKQIEDEGNDPAKPFNKIATPTESDGGGDNGGGENDLGEPMPEMPEEPSQAPKPPEPKAGEGSEKGSPIAEKIKKPYIRPSQAGNKKSSDYPFGEDKIGKLSFSRKSSTDPIRHKYKNDSAINFEGLDSLLTTLEADKKSLLIESNDGKMTSYMDESNITT